MQDIMYRVNFRDGDFMKVQSILQTIDGKRSNVDPLGVFEYEKHKELVDKLQSSGLKTSTSAKMTHFVPTRQELEEQDRESKLKRRDQARKVMIAKFEAENPPMNDREKQLALQDNKKLLKTMEMANRVIEQKYQPKGTAKSNSPFLLANAVGFDSIKMLNKMEEDKKAREERQHRI